jgi:NAD(P)-dependent dehydrogenase (short-subunit alcohol dehydrogenase family)
MDLKKFLKTLEVNFLFNVFLMKFLYPLIKDKKNLLIILFSGGGSLSFRENFSSYSISKTSLIKFTEIISEEFKNKKIRANIISPGIINSNMTRKIINFKNKNLIKNETARIKKFINMSDITKEKIYSTINFLNSQKGSKISGKIISSMWDNPKQWGPIKIKKIIDNQLYTLTRKK